MSDIVKKAQQASIDYCGHKIKLTGEYDKASKENGFRCLQKALNKAYKKKLTVDGIWGVKSIEAFGSHYVEYGNKSDMVKALQILLGLRGYTMKNFDGVFGQLTFEAVKKFQKKTGLHVDGIAGGDTFGYLSKAIVNFKPDEFKCQGPDKCGGDVIPELKMKAQMLRNKIGLAMTITDGYRCPSYNASVGGTSDSLHMQRKAFDMQVFKNGTYHMTDADQKKYRTYAHQCGLTTGNYYGSGGGWMHCQIGRNDYDLWP